MKCLMIAASHRKDSLNRKLVLAARPLLEAEGFLVDAPDYGILDLPLFNDRQREEGDIPKACHLVARHFKEADAYIIASPEYNWSYPGTLKNMLDWLSHFSPCPLEKKSALLMSATPSRRGGVMGVAHLKTVLEALGVYVYPSSYLLGGAHGMFDAEERLATDQNARLQTLLHDFSAFARALKASTAKDM